MALRRAVSGYVGHNESKPQTPVAKLRFGCELDRSSFSNFTYNLELRKCDFPRDHSSEHELIRINKAGTLQIERKDWWDRHSPFIEVILLTHLSWFEHSSSWLHHMYVQPLFPPHDWSNTQVACTIIGIKAHGVDDLKGPLPCAPFPPSHNVFAFCFEHYY
jgi:hypothetical protein